MGARQLFRVPVEGGNRQWENPRFFGKEWRFWSLGEWDLSGRSGSMDGATAALKRKLNRLLKVAAQVSVDLDRADGTITGVPHYSVIEARAHELGQQLSREIQARQMGKLVMGRMATAPCPKCRARCELRLASADATRPGTMPRRSPSRSEAFSRKPDTRRWAACVWTLSVSWTGPPSLLASTAAALGTRTQ